MKDSTKLSSLFLLLHHALVSVRLDVVAHSEIKHLQFSSII